MKNTVCRVLSTLAFFVSVIPVMAAPPVISSQAPSEVNIGEVYMYEVSASDPEGGSLTYSFSYNPPNMSINQQGQVSWDTSPHGVGDYYFGLVVEDEEGLTANEHAAIRVFDPNNNPPVIAATPSPEAHINTLYSFNILASDPDGDDLIYRVNSWPSIDGLNIDDSGVVSLTATENQIGEYWVWIEADDQKFGVAKFSYDFRIIDPTNNAPVFGNVPADATVSVGGSYSHDLLATDADGDPITYRLEVWPEAPGLSVSSAGVIQWQPTSDDVGIYYVNIYAQDNRLGETFKAYELVVQSFGNQAPFIDSAPVEQVEIGSTYLYDVEASDPDSDPLTYSLQSAPAGMSIDSTTGVITWQPLGVGSYPVEVGVSDGVNGVVIQIFTLTVIPENEAPEITLNTPFDGELYLDIDTIQFQAEANDIEEGDISDEIEWSSDVDDYLGSGAEIQSTLSVGTHVITATVSDSYLASDTVQITVHVNASPTLPDNPETTAPEITLDKVLSFKDSVEFLYSGPSPIQIGVSEDTMEDERVGVLRGEVSDSDGQPLPGVRVSIFDHAEFGHTFTRSDGKYDLAINAGGNLVVDFERVGYLPAQRRVDTQWRQFGTVPDVALVRLDPEVTEVDSSGSAASVQVAQSTVQEDLDGERQVTVIFPAGIDATLELPGGGSQSISNMSFRATEYTVGANGQERMPGGLPLNSAYTYAVELSVDEAIAAGAETVTFNQSVPVYVDNFIGFPIGEAVPSAWYDRNRAEWIPSQNGRVIEVLSITSGLVDLDIDGSGVPASDAELSALGVTIGEREALAGLYGPGDSLWRVMVDHFTPWDFNWTARLPEDAAPPPNTEPELANEDEPFSEDADECLGCIIEAQGQLLGEEVPLVGIDQSLHYKSDRSEGYNAGRTLTIPLSDDDIPASVQSIRLTVTAAGRRIFSQNYSPQINLNQTVVWDGRDAYGREIPSTLAKIAVSYTYQVTYVQANPNILQTFGQIPSASLPIGNRTSTTNSIGRLWTKKLVNNPPDASGLGGWSLTNHHTYDPTTQTLYLGNGQKQSANSLDLNVVQTIAGTGVYGIGEDDIPALESDLQSIQDIAFDAAGNMYLSEGHRVRRVRTDGIIETVAGTDVGGFSGDGGLAVDAELSSPYGIDVAEDGTVYIADLGNNRIRMVTPDGVINTIVGTGNTAYNGDGIPAASANLNWPSDVAIAPDGSLYIADTNHARVRRIAPDGNIYTVAGNGGMGSFEPDNVLATETQVRYPTVLEFGADGSLYILQHNNFSVRRVDSAGIITRITSNAQGETDDGLPLSESLFRYIKDIAISDDGSLYFAEEQNYKIRKALPSEVVNTVVGTGDRAVSPTSDPIIEGDYAINEDLWYPTVVATDPNGDVYYVKNYSVRKVASAFPGFSQENIVISSRDGQEAYIFDSEGRHLSTVNTFTGSTIRTFAYTDDGLLDTVTDAYGNVTSISRLSDGTPTTIVGPYGQSTQLVIDGDGLLSQVFNPAGEDHEMRYTAEGLMTQFTDPRENSNFLTYDGSGRLIQDVDAEGGGWTLVRSHTGGNFSVTMTSGEGVARTFGVQPQSSGARVHIATAPDGTDSTTQFNTDGSELRTLADGTQIETTEIPDPRFSVLSPLENTTVTTPSGLEFVSTIDRIVTLSEPGNVLGLTSLTDEVQLNSQTYLREYDGATRTWTYTSPEGRAHTMVLDASGRVIAEHVPGLADVNYSYDSFGRLNNMTQGNGVSARSMEIDYNAEGYVSTITDALGREVGFIYDDAGRVSLQRLPDNRDIAFAYDSAGNIAGVSPPSRPEHGYLYSDVDQLTQYTPPDISGDDGIKTYSYNLDKQITDVFYPSGEQRTFTRDSVGRIDIIGSAYDDIDYNYDFTTGQLNEVDASAISIAYQYDGFLLTEESVSGTVNGSVGYAYDNDFRLTAINVNGTDAIIYDYDNDGLMVQAGTMDLVRHPDNGLLNDTQLGGMSSVYGYNEFSELTSQTVAASGSTLYSASYEHDALGRITDKTEVIQGATNTYEYDYDLAGRLYEVTLNNAVVEFYVYDDNGNRISATVNGVTSAASVDDRDRLNQYGATSFFYDDNGAVQTKVTGSNSTSYVYDSQNNLRHVTLPDGTSIDYVIDGNNRRVGKRVNGTLVQGFLYQDELNPIAELDGSSNVVSRFIYAEKGHVPAVMVRAGITYRVISDHLGSVRLVVNSVTGAIAQRLDYDSYGNVVLDTNPGFQPFGFAGGVYDGDTALVRFGARDYSAEVGRWLQVDPIGQRDGPNTYLYAQANPLFYTDPQGLAVCGGACIGPAIVIGGRILLNQAAKRAAKKAAQRAAGAAAAAGGNDPNGDKCQRLAEKIQRTRDEIYNKRFPDLMNNPGNLPQRIGPGERLRDTVRGHEKLLNRRLNELKKLEDQYDQQCRQECP